MAVAVEYSLNEFATSVFHPPILNNVCDIVYILFNK